MRRKSFPPVRDGGSLCGRTWQRSRTATPRSQRKYERAVRASRTWDLLGDLYVGQWLRVSRCDDWFLVNRKCWVECERSEEVDRSPGQKAGERGRAFRSDSRRR